MITVWRALICGLVLTACGPSSVEPGDEQLPPTLPEGVETVVFEPEARTAATETPTTQSTAAASVYWGIEDGEPLPLMWEDLMPEGSEEALAKEYEAFYAMLEKRYAANTTTLFEASTYSGIEEGSELDFMPQLGSFDTVSELDDTLIRIPGYAVPFDFSAEHRSATFLFVPYMGACIHSPPPPPNQIIFVRADPAIRIPDIWSPYWLEGTLNTERTDNELGNTAYALTLDKLDPYPMP